MFGVRIQIEIGRWCIFKMYGCVSMGISEYYLIVEPSKCSVRLPARFRTYHITQGLNENHTLGPSTGMVTLHCIVMTNLTLPPRAFRDLG